MAVNKAVARLEQRLLRDRCLRAVAKMEKSIIFMSRRDPSKNCKDCRPFSVTVQVKNSLRGHSLKTEPWL